jgi:two-component system sensor histidine kinase RpfC
MANALRIWWKAQKARGNYGEFAQACLRVGIAVVLMSAYYAWVDWSAQTWVRYLCWAFVVLSFVLFVWIYRAKESSDVVRFITLAVDMGTPTVLLGLTGERSAILVFVYTWVAVGHGFRFGLKYLHVAWIVSLVAFALVYTLSAAVGGFWYQHPLVWLGAFFWVGAPTFYVAQLLKQKLVAVREAEEARVQVERAQADAERERVERARAEAERARAEAEAASEAKSDFLATMSHEMRTPLNGVVGAAEMLAAAKLPQKERQLVDWLLASSRQLRSLIDNLLDLRKIEAGKIAIEPVPLDLHVLMNRLATLFEPEAKRSHLRFTKSISVNAPYLLIGDELRIQQVLINLIANALKFTQQGFVRVSVSVAEQSNYGVTLRFEVRDTGIGISADQAPSIFDRFSQANPAIHKQYGGSGLGTTICKHLVELMDGNIRFDSNPGEGTVFSFTVPLSRQPAEAYEDGIALSARNAQLLFVSSRSDLRAWFAMASQERELQCSCVASVTDAIEATSKDQFQLPCVCIIDGSDASMTWQDVPTSIRAVGSPISCILFHSHATEPEAFDAGYVSLLKSKDSRLLARAVRSVVAGGSLPQTATSSPGEQTDGHSGLRILVAEDNQISQQMIAMMLRGGSHHVTLVSDGDSVIENYRNVTFDALILDMHMPGRTGLEVVRTIRALEARAQQRRVPIIMLTAAASIDLRDSSLDAGVDLFLSKPVNPRDLLRGVAQLFAASDGAGALPVLAMRSAPIEQHYVDRVLLRDMADLAADPRFLQTLTDKFATDAQELIDRIEAALKRKDQHQVSELTHALKGAAMMAGAVRLRDSAAQLETLCNHDFGRMPSGVIDELRGTLKATNDELSKMVA